MTQEERWKERYDEVKGFIETNQRNPSKYALEEKLMVVMWRREVADEGTSTGQVTGQVKEPVRRLVLVLGEQTLTRKQLMELLSLKGRDNFRVNYLEPSMSEGIVLKLYPESDNRPDQAYYLSEKGLQLLMELKLSK